GSKQISHYAILKNIRETNDIEIESLWPGNPGLFSNSDPPLTPLSLNTFTNS
ncbi:unnamed protein product, partial [marine sediment metagenome]